MNAVIPEPGADQKQPGHTKKSAPKSKGPREKSTPAKKPAPNTAVPKNSTRRKGREVEMRKGSKSAKIVALLRRPAGTTIAALMKATGWQAHSVRAFLSATLRARRGLKITSTTNEKGDRIYRVRR